MKDKNILSAMKKMRIEELEELYDIVSKKSSREVVEESFSRMSLGEVLFARVVLGEMDEDGAVASMDRVREEVLIAIREEIMAMVDGIKEEPKSRMCWTPGCDNPLPTLGNGRDWIEIEDGGSGDGRCPICDTPFTCPRCGYCEPHHMLGIAQYAPSMDDLAQIIDYMEERSPGALSGATGMTNRQDLCKAVWHSLAAEVGQAMAEYFMNGRIFNIYSIK